MILCSGKKKIVFGEEWLYSGKSGCTRAKVVGFGQKWLLFLPKVVVFVEKIGCIRCKSGCDLAKGGCIRAKVVVFGQSIFFTIQPLCKKCNHFLPEVQPPSGKKYNHFCSKTNTCTRVQTLCIRIQTLDAFEYNQLFYPENNYVLPEYKVLVFGQLQPLYSPEYNHSCPNRTNHLYSNTTTGCIRIQPLGCFRIQPLVVFRIQPLVVIRIQPLVAGITQLG